MTGPWRLAAALLVLVLGHVLAPLTVALIAAEVVAFAAGLVALGWLLAVTSHTWMRPQPLRAGGAP